MCVLIAAIFLPLGGCKWQRPDFVPSDAVYTGNVTFDGVWVDCDAWAAGSIATCSTYTNRLAESGLYYLSESGTFGELLAGDSGQRWRDIWGKLDWSFVGQLRYVSAKRVELVPIDVVGYDVQGVKSELFVMFDPCVTWLEKNEPSSFLEYVDRSFDASSAYGFLEKVELLDDMSTIKTFPPVTVVPGIENSSTWFVVTGKSDAYSAQIVGDCWGQVGLRSN